MRMSSMKLKAWMDQQLEENIERLLDRWSFSGPAGQKRGHAVVRDGNTTYTYGCQMKVRDLEWMVGSLLGVSGE